MMVVMGEWDDAKRNHGGHLIFNLKNDVGDACVLFYLMFIHGR